MSQLHQAGLNAFVVDAIDGDAFTSQDRSVLDCRNLRELWVIVVLVSVQSTAAESMLNSRAGSPWSTTIKHGGVTENLSFFDYACNGVAKLPTARGRDR